MPLPIRLRSLLLAAGLTSTLILPAALSQASAATMAPGSGPARWRVAEVVGPRNGVTYPDFFDVTSRSDAWSWWVTSCSPCPAGPGFNFLEQWNGIRWIKKRTPAAAAGGIVGLGASSRRNLWLFTVDTIRGHTVKRAVVWTGTWHTLRLPDWMIIPGAGFYSVQPEVFGPRSVWLFEHALPAVDVYNGRHWTRRALPGYPGDISVISPTDIWALGRARSAPGRQILMHWSGSHWRTLQIPRPTRIPKNSNEYVDGLVATAPHDLWLARYILTGSQGARTLYLLHWVRGTWHKVLFRFPTSWTLPSAPDGNGGLWMASNGRAPRYPWYFDHLSRTGRWTRQAGPTAPGLNFGQIVSLQLPMVPMAWIPGTISVWATGNLDPRHNSNAVLGAIFKYGP